MSSPTIYINERCIRFTDEPSQPGMPGLLVADYHGPGQLLRDWKRFLASDQYACLTIRENESAGPGRSRAFRAFTGLFPAAYAAGGIVFNERSEILFIYRLGRWDLPKGRIEAADIPGPGFTIMDSPAAVRAAVREVKEETGLQTLEPGSELPSTWHMFKKGKHYLLKQTRWYRMSGSSEELLVPQTEEGISDVRWIPGSRLDEVIRDTYASLRELLRLTLPPATG